MDHFWTNSQNTVFSRRQLFKKLEERNSSINNAKQRLVHCCTRLSVAMSWERANDRYKDHLDGQLTKQTGETNICGCGTGISPHGSQAEHQVGLCEEEDHAERRRGGDRDHGGEQQLKTGRQRVGAGGDLITQAKKGWWYFSLKLCFF